MAWADYTVQRYIVKADICIWLSAYRLSGIAISLSGYGSGYRVIGPSSYRRSGDRAIDDRAIHDRAIHDRAIDDRAIGLSAIGLLMIGRSRYRRSRYRRSRCRRSSY
jgi:hypothetical protein